MTHVKSVEITNKQVVRGVDVKCCFSKELRITTVRLPLVQTF